MVKFYFSTERVIFSAIFVTWKINMDTSILPTRTAMTVGAVIASIDARGFFIGMANIGMVSFCGWYLLRYEAFP